MPAILNDYLERLFQFRVFVLKFFEKQVKRLFFLVDKLDERNDRSKGFELLLRFDTTSAGVSLSSFCLSFCLSADLSNCVN